MKRIELIGTVFSGQGNGRRFLELPWVKRQVIEKLSFYPYPGTLNLKLNKKSIKKRKLLKKAPAERIFPAKGYYKGVLFKTYIGILECAIVIPQVPEYPDDLLEVIASVNLRKTLQLEDGCEVTVTANL